MTNLTPKVWGIEDLLVSEPEYTAKYLQLNPGFQCSLHKHIIKKETFYVLDGWCYLEIGEHPVGKKILAETDSYTIEPGTYHRFSSPKGSDGCLILEVSTKHEDSDVVRAEESKALDEC